MNSSIFTGYSLQAGKEFVVSKRIVFTLYLHYERPFLVTNLQRCTMLDASNWKITESVSSVTVVWVPNKIIL